LSGSLIKGKFAKKQRKEKVESPNWLEAKKKERNKREKSIENRGK
jgi:hypothetical protein